jgi:flagellar protein FlgJ
MQIDKISAQSGFNSFQSAQTAAEDHTFSDQLKKTQAQVATSMKDDKKLRNTCKDFEAMYLNLMYSKMRETVPDNPLFGSSNGEKIMQSMLDTELTKQMANAGGVGLADMMYKQLSHLNK